MLFSQPPLEVVHDDVSPLSIHTLSPSIKFHNLNMTTNWSEASGLLLRGYEIPATVTISVIKQDL